MVWSLALAFCGGADAFARVHVLPGRLFRTSAILDKEVVTLTPSTKEDQPTESEKTHISEAFLPGINGQPIPGSDILVAALELAGVDTCFAYPGGASLEIHQSLIRSSLIKNILCRHEQGEVFAAEGYAKSTGKVGVCIATSGPGATNLITGIADAYCDSVPLLAITGQVAQSLIGLNSFQEMPVVDLVRPITKKAYMITDINSVAEIVLEAMFVARSGRPGPVLIDFPKNIQQQRTVPSFSTPLNHFLNQDLVVERIKAELPDKPLRRILDKISEAERPLLYIGGGCANAAPALREFVERTGLPVVQTLMGLGTMPASSPQNLGMLGMHGTVVSNYAVHNADLLLAFGVRFDDRVTGKVEQFARHAHIIHVDVDPKEIGKIKAVQQSLVADVNQLLERLNEMMADEETDKVNKHAEWMAKLEEKESKYPMHYKTKEIEGQIRPEYAIAKLSEIAAIEIPDPKNLCVTTGVGQHQMWAAQHFNFESERRFLTSGGLGSMGFGLPSALGAAVALPDATIIDIDGDGSFQMNIQELATVAIEKLNTKMVILNNQYLGMVFQWENTFYKRRRAHTFLGDPDQPGVIYPDFIKISEGYGVPALRVFNEADMIKAYEQMLRTPGPFLVDVVCADNHVYPMIPSGKGYEDIMLKDPSFGPGEEEPEEPSEPTGLL